MAVWGDRKLLQVITNKRKLCTMWKGSTRKAKVPRLQCIFKNFHGKEEHHLLGCRPIREPASQHESRFESSSTILNGKGYVT